MLILLKIVHMFSLFAGGAASIGNGLLLKKVIASKAPPPPMVAQTMGIIGKIGFGAIVLLWLSGLGMMFASYDISALDWTFWVKMAGATAVLVPVTMMTAIARKAETTGTPPDLTRMKSLASIARGGVAIAIIFGVLAFN
ncbi:hypothetical protein [Nioella aestuarii]|uniref:hypothetical protein n=1 Tax=Nioella aestuarii TaxID=1662864 RepID=UPI003D7FDEDC